ncbi:SIR2 family protein [Novosphingobium sp. AP12]|uniref:SIR2 family protein n=1 Tax=Novosphingobium sp. AP12 TaxID=1144305 RepID=UPI0012F9EB14|nr:SIR2 family protein [Novosphingobium sp. AP12]
MITELGVASESTAAQVLDIAQNLPAIDGVGSVVATDQIFGLLERDFPVQNVRRAVSKAVKPPETAILDAHRSLLDLSRGPDGVTRLVTTNFDLLFEAAASTPLDCLVPPLFPNPSKGAGFRGIVHLHGKVNDAYDDIDSEEFVLSSADFGRAYLSDGWATRFMQALIERFRIVFVGYSADDPPLKYLLEALRPNYAGDRLYAFQSGTAKAASTLWMQKGVTAIPFDRFDQLWSTITLWAKRARDPEAWHNSIAELASQPPGSLNPFERGQIAQLVSSQVGARAFLAAKPTPPAQWLGVFDPAIRYATPRDRLIDPKGTAIDPFAQFGLDSDLLPSPSNPQNPRSDRALPDGAWSALEPLPTDTYPNSSIPRSSMRGGSAQDPHQLSSRQFILSNWLGGVAEQPFAMWWAAGQHHLHPALSEAIERTFETPTADAALRQTWRDLVDAKRKNNLRYGGHDLAAYGVVSSATASGGWSEWYMQRLFEATEPRLAVRRSWTDVPVDPTASSDNVLSWEVHYPTYPEVEVPDEWLRRYVEGLRSNLTLAVALETRLRSEPYFMLRPFESANGDDEHDFGINHASDFAHRLVDALRRLIAHDPQAASVEDRALPRGYRRIVGILLSAWRQHDDSGSRLLSSEDLKAALMTASDADRVMALNQLMRWNEDATADPPAPNPLADKLAFLEEVWPRQSFVRSGGAMSALAQIALTGGEHVSILTEAILPLLTRVANAAPLGLWWMRSQDETVAVNPEEYLAVMSAILPVRAGDWPYGVQQLVEKLARIADLKGDPRLVELQRRIAGI